MDTTSSQPVGHIEIAMEFEISASRERCWKAFTEETAEWTYKDFAMLNPKGKLTFEAWAGGRMYEENENGDGLLWYYVMHIVQGSSMILIGTISPPWGGPASSHLGITFTDMDDGRTKMTVTDNLYGVVSEKMHKEIHAGWLQFYNDSFIPYVEGK